MPPLVIDIHEIPVELLQPTDSPALTDAVQAAMNPSQPIIDGAGFDNTCRPAWPA